MPAAHAGTPDESSTHAVVLFARVRLYTATGWTPAHASGAPIIDCTNRCSEYASVLNATAQNLRELATALDTNNNAEADRANHELERLNIRERSAVSRMDSWCQSD